MDTETSLFSVISGELSRALGVLTLISLLSENDDLSGGRGRDRFVGETGESFPFTRTPSSSFLLFSDGFRVSRLRAGVGLATGMAIMSRSFLDKSDAF